MVIKELCDILDELYLANLLGIMIYLELVYFRR